MSALKTSQKQSRRWHPLKRSRTLARATFPDFIERDGEKFFQTGRLIANTLEQFSKSLQTTRFSNMEQFYSSNFSGNSLGLMRPLPRAERDGIREFHFYSDNTSCTAKEALSEWRLYASSFDEIREISLHLHKLERDRKSTRLNSSH